ncbi:hypothetical protein MACJ_001652 [Theileria orientalis]|uniref:Uncharacterized protein n=1 Tax=Theileria orientalis TaxID=68886 RepID=A0A976MB77_THEOR|nr:hypothetical protein MACJ_001652 [Theileria orientalis]
MPSIFLCHTSGEYETGNVRIKVSKDSDYKELHLFNRYKHELTPLSLSEIRVYKERHSDWSFTNSDYLSITLDSSYSDAKLKCVEVYFNAYDIDSKFPLIFVLYFEGQETHQPKYLKYSCFNNQISEKQTINISGASNFVYVEKDKDLIPELLEENDKLTEVLTFRVDKEDSSIYNNGKIYLSSKYRIYGPNGNSYGFYKRTHTPKESGSEKKSYVLCNNDVLLSWHTNGYGEYTDIPNVQREKYTNLIVYWSDKVKIPLMVEFVKKIHEKDEHSYYFQNQYKHRPYWQRLYDKTFENLLGESIQDNLIHDTLIQDNNSKLLKALEKIEFLLINTIIILLEKVTSYGETDVEKLIKKENPQITFTSKITEAQPDPVNVVKNYCKKLEDFGYLCYRHSFRISESYKLGELRLFLPSEHINKYTELRLYSDVNTSVPDVLYYKDGKVDMYVYFYQSSTTRGTTGDPRPLLLIYDSKVYRPLNLDTYNIRWVRLNGVTAFSCDNFDDVLISVLSEVVGFLNIVNLDNIHDHPAETEPNTKADFDNSTYSVQKFNGQSIDIKITYENKNCYRVYRYTPSNTNGYRLGLVTHGKNKINIQYPLNKQLKCVSTYYNVYDFYLEHPVLVELKFSETDREYYIVRIEDGQKAWEKLESYNVDQSNIEKSLYKIRSELGISFIGRKDGKTLFDPKNCNENKNRGVVLGLLTGLTLVVGGVGVAYYKYPQFSQFFYRRFY